MSLNVNQDVLYYYHTMFEDKQEKNAFMLFSIEIYQVQF